MPASESTLINKLKRLVFSKNTPLHVAIGSKTSKNRLKIVEALLNHEGIEVNAKNKEGDTPLHVAARKGQTEVVMALLNHTGIEVNATNEKGDTPLHVALWHKFREIILALLNHKGIDVNQTTSDEYTPLHLAARRGNLEVVKALLNHEGIKVNSKTSDEYTPLHLAAFNGYTEVVNALLDRGADVNSKTKGGNTPLHDAVHGGVDVVKALLARGADAELKDSTFKETPLELAVRHNSSDVIPLLTKWLVKSQFVQKGFVFGTEKGEEDTIVLLSATTNKKVNQAKNLFTENKEMCPICSEVWTECTPGISLCLQNKCLTVFCEQCKNKWEKGSVLTCVICRKGNAGWMPVKRDPAAPSEGGTRRRRRSLRRSLRRPPFRRSLRRPPFRRPG